MTEIKKYEGSWIDYQKDLEKLVLEKVIHDRPGYERGHPAHEIVGAVDEEGDEDDDE